MPPKKIIEYTVYIIDCNKSIEEKLEQFYSICAVKTFSRQTKVKAPHQNRVLLIKDTVEPLTDWNLYRLKTLRIVRQACLADRETQEPHNHNNFLRAINIAVQSLDQIEDKKNILIKRIVLFTDLQYPVNDKDKHVERINQQLAASSATLYIIGVESAKIPALHSRQEIQKLFKLDYIEDTDNIDLTKSLNVVRRLARNNIMVLNYEDGFHLLFSYREQIKGSFPWYVGLGIGTDFRLPVMCYKIIRKHFNVPMRRAPSAKGVKYTTDKAHFDLLTHEEVSRDDIVRGYRFNGKFVTFTPEQEDAMKKMRKINKCLSIIAIVSAEQIPIHLYAFECSMNKVKPDKRSPRYKDEGFRLFVAALRARNLVALCRRVYNNGNNPNLFAMFPCPEHKTNKYLLMAQIPYRHQFKDRFYHGVQVKLENPNPELKEHVFEFLDAMTSGPENGRPIHPLTENLKFNMNRARQYKFLAKVDLEHSPGDPPTVDIHPYLLKRARDPAENLLKYLEQ